MPLQKTINRALILHKKGLKQEERRRREEEEKGKGESSPPRPPPEFFPPLEYVGTLRDIRENAGILPNFHVMLKFFPINDRVPS
ncbi:hypothetical protein KFK09_014938 [Dendrobium nobile]|uniref:Uncharacterized protein n=1 Tax=Dendrobium nobile TaxID=94219 RepID=A0A8T3B4J5_DENNO|nr:hypothetical protein KFK09_014938 [Dendrobium nobile]